MSKWSKINLIYFLKEMPGSTHNSKGILAEIHSHPRDNNVVFDESSHTYTICGKNIGWKSVTSILSSLQPHFDPKEAYKMITKSRAWKSGTHKYYGKTLEEIQDLWQSENRAGTLLHAQMENEMNKIVALEKGFLSDEQDELSVKPLEVDGRMIEWCPSTREAFLEYENELFPIGWIREDFKLVRELSTSVELLESDFVDVQTAFDERRQIEAFFEDHQWLEPQRSEWVIYDEDYCIAGTIDAVFRDKKSGDLWIYDWKRVAKGLEPDEIAVTMGLEVDDNDFFGYSIKDNKYRKWMKKPVSHLPDTKQWHYSLQLNLYRKLLEKNYGVRVMGMRLVQIHPTLKKYQIHDVVLLEKEINELLERRQSELTEMKSKEKN